MLRLVSACGLAAPHARPVALLGVVLPALHTRAQPLDLVGVVGGHGATHVRNPRSMTVVPLALWLSVRDAEVVHHSPMKASAMTRFSLKGAGHWMKPGREPCACSSRIRAHAMSPSSSV